MTDPACVWSWAFEPVVWALMVEFGDDLEWTFVMGGLAREYGDDAGWGPEGGHGGMARHWLEAADETGMPTDPLAWAEEPLRSTYPACRAVKAAQLQGRAAGYRYLRALREGIVCRRRPLDVARRSDKVRCSADDRSERVPFPTLRFDGPDGATRWTCGMRSLDYVRDAALAVGTQPASEPRPTVLAAA